MPEVGAFDAKTHLPQPLRRVQAGERAEPAPFRPRDAGRIRSAIDSLKAFQRSHRLRGLSVRRMIEEGRRS